jgi:hypothetical protein
VLSAQAAPNMSGMASSKNANGKQEWKDMVRLHLYLYGFNVRRIYAC